MIQKLTEKMIEYYTGDPKRIQHFIKSTRSHGTSG